MDANQNNNYAYNKFLQLYYDETYIKDLQKQKDLEDAGFKVIRFTDEEVLKNMNNVIAELENVIEELELSTPNPRQRGTKTEHKRQCAILNIEQKNNPEGMPSALKIKL